MTITNHLPKPRRNDPQMAHVPTPLTADAGTFSDKLFIPGCSEFVESSIPQSPQIGLWLWAFPKALTPKPYRVYVSDTLEAWSVSAPVPRTTETGGMFTLLATNCLNSHPTNPLPTFTELSKDLRRLKLRQNYFSNTIRNCRADIFCFTL